MTESDPAFAGSAPIAIGRQWQRCDSTGSGCADLAGETGATYVLVPGDVGNTVRVVVTGSNGVGSPDVATSSPTGVVQAIPVTHTGTATISGTAQDGQTLTDPEPTFSGTPPITVTDQWQQCDSTGAGCSNIAGANGTTYVLTPTDVGHTIRVLVTGSNASLPGGGSDTVTSAVTGVVQAIPVTHTGTATISGNAVDGDTLTGSDPSFTGSPPITVTRQWQQCDSTGAGCSDITGAGASTYVLTPGDVGHTIRVMVTGSNAGLPGGGSDTVTSAATGVVQAIPVTHTGNATISGNAVDGDTLTGGDPSFSGSPPITVTQQWQQCDSTGASCSDIGGATGASYVLTPGDVGHTIRFVVTGDNTALPGGTKDVVTSAATAVVDEPPTVSSTAPANGATSVATNATVTVTFSKPVSVTGSAFKLECPTGTPQPFTVTPASPASTFVLQPTSALPAGTVCTVTVVAAQVQDAAGAQLGADYVFSFTVDTPPTVTSTVPAANATNVATSSTIQITFSKAVSATTGSFTLGCPTGTPQTFSVSGSGTATITLIPSANLPVDTTCALTVLASGITDSAGSPLAADFSFSFQTVLPLPVAVADNYTATGNVGLTVAPAANGVLANDTLNTGSLHGFGATSASADGTVPNGTNTVTTSNGGTVTLSADGTFSYDPPAGYTGTNGFYYDLHNASGDAVGHVTITISNMIWFINNSAASCTTIAAGCGRLSNPFSTLAAFEALNSGAAPNPQTGDTIFLYSGAGAYTGGVTLRDGQILIGQGASASIPTISGITLAPFSNGLPATGGTSPSVTTSAASTNAITLGSSNTVRGLDIGNKTGAGIAGTNFGTLTLSEVNVTGTGEALNLNTGTANATFGTLSSSSGSDGVGLISVAGSQSATGGTLTGASGDELLINGGTGSFSYAGAITNTGTSHAVNVTGKTGGTITLSGPISDTSGSGSGISLTSNTGATIDLTGGVTLSTGTQAAFVATGGGTLNVTGTGSTLTTSTATALNVSSTTIGSSGLTFQSISSNGANPGISLSSTGSSGGLSVTGSGTTPGSGGTIENSAGEGINLSSTSAPSFTDMIIENNAGDGITGTQVSGFTLAGSTVSGNGTAANVNDQTENEDGLNFSSNFTGSPDGLTGTVSITNSTITGNSDNNAVINDTSGTLNLTVTGTTFSTNNSTLGNDDGLDVNADGSTSATVSVTGSTFTNNIGNAFEFMTDSAASGTNSVTFSTNTVSSTSNTPGGTISAGNVEIIPSGTSKNTITVDSNTITKPVDDGISIDDNGSGTLSGTIDGNTVGSPTVAGSGSSEQNDIGVSVENTATETLAITNNKLYQYANVAGIEWFNRVGNPTMNLTVTGNTIADPAGNATTGGAWGIYGEGGALTTDNGKLCADITGNSLTGSGQLSLGSYDIELDQTGSVTYELPGYTGGSTDTNAVQTFLAGNNSDSASNILATVNGGGFSGGASCPTPS